MTLIKANSCQKRGVNLAPMIDFLFLMLAFFATLAVSRITTMDTEIDLVEIESSSKEESQQLPEDEEIKIIRLSISKNKKYQWITEIRDYPMESPKQIVEELLRQYDMGILSKDKSKTQIFIKIDKEASWDSVLTLIVAIQEEDFSPRPIYEVKGEE